MKTWIWLGAWLVCGCAGEGERDLLESSTSGAGNAGGSAATSGAGGSATECLPPSELPQLPPLGERRCMGLEPGVTWAPTDQGPFQVGVRTLELADPLRPGRTLTTEVWYPADASVAGQEGASYSLTMQQIAAMLDVDLPFSWGGIQMVQTDAVRDAPRAPVDPAAGLVVFSHGFRGVRFQSTFLTVFLASHGYVVASPDHQGNTLYDGSATPEQSAVDRVEDMGFVTSEMVARTRSSNDFFANSFDPRRVAWTGHSFGASTAIMAGALDNREMVNLPLAPAFDDRMALVYNPLSYDLRAATFLFGAEDDDTTPLDNQQLAYDRTIAPRHLITLAGARHTDFTDICANALLALMPVVGDGCGADPQGTQLAVRTLVTAALHRYLRCDPAAQSWLDPGAVASMPAVAAFVADTGAALPSPDPEAPMCDVEPTGDEVLHEALDITRTDAPTLHVEWSGPAKETTPLVFVHGFGTTGAIFERQIEALASHHRIVTFDLRGHGQSGGDPSAPHGADGLPGTSDDPYQLASYVDDLVDVLEQLDLHEAVLVGWSSGGQVALEAALASERVRALVWVDAAPLTRADPALHLDYNGGATVEFGRDLRLALDASLPEAWRPVVENFFARDPQPTLVDDYFQRVTATDPATRLGQITAPRPDLVDSLASFDRPMLIIHGEQDDALLLESAQFTAAAIADAELVVFQRSGHAPFAEEPEHFNHVLEDFVDSLP